MPDVDVFVTACREPEELLENTLKACRGLQYPKDRLHIWVLDDGDSPQLEKIAKCLEIGYITRKEHKGAKAGNLNHALGLTKAPLLVIIDADMAPRPDFLMKTVPYFLQEDGEGNPIERTKIGFLQTPQAFRNEDLWQSVFHAGRRIPNEQENFYRNLEPSRNAANAVVFGGSNAVLLRRAVEETGGFCEGTLTEDYATGLKIQKAGYQGLAIDEVLAEGLSADNLKSLIKQRERWARGTIQTVHSCGLFEKGFTFSQRINIIASISYWYFPLEKLIFFLAPLFFPLFGIPLLEAELSQMLLHYLPLYILSCVGMCFFSGSHYNLSNIRWSYIYDMSLPPFLLIPILKESFGIRETKFAVTGFAGKRKSWHWYYPIPFVILYLLSIVALCKTGIMISKMRSGGYFFLLFWQLVNLYYMSFEILFIWRAKKEGEKISGYDNLAHNLDGNYPPLIDLALLVTHPFYKKKEGNTGAQKEDIIVLQKLSSRERKEEFHKKWSGKRVKNAALTYLIEAVVIIAVFLITHGAKAVVMDSSYRNELSRNDSRYFQMANWKNTDERFLNDFKTQNILFEDGQMQLLLTDGWNGSCSGAEYRTVNYYRDGNGNHEYLYDLGFDASEDFHEYSFRWNEAGITWYVDGEECYHISAQGNDLPKTPSHIMMNLWAGDAEAPGMKEWLGVYEPAETKVAAYDWFSYDPE